MINGSERKYLIECLANGKDIPEENTGEIE